MDINIYIINSDKGIVLTQAFYDLGLKQKYEVVEIFISMGLLDNIKFYDRVIRALLQHSSPELRKEYPCMGDRKIRKAAKIADEMEGINA